MIIFQPFIALIRVLFEFNHNLTGNYGVSLVLLSLEVTILMLPFYYLAERWKRAEEKIQGQMKSEIDSIKAAYTGQKRFYLIQETHRLFNYKSIYALRVTFGLLIQIPLFLAAYEYLSAYEGYQGVSFGPIRNLGAQDHLLFGINIMPFIMTAVNLVASFLYAKGGKRTDKIQLVVMAFLFLVLLYDRPAGLVFYWTMNNLFSIPKNLWLKKVCPPPFNVKEEKLDIRKFFHKPIGSWIIWGTPFILLITELLLVDKFPWISKIIVAGSAVPGILASLVFFFFWIRRFKSKISKWTHLVLPAVCWLVFALISYDSIVEGPLERNFADAPIHLILFLCQFLITGFTTHYILRKEDFRRKREAKPISRRQKIIFAVGFPLLACFTFLFVPVITYSGSTYDLQTPIGRFVLENLFVLIPVLLAGFAVFWLFKKQRFQLVRICVVGLMMILIYFYLLPSRFGQLDGNILMAADRLDKIHFGLYYLDAAIILGLLWLSGKWLKERPRVILAGTVIMSIAITGLFGYKLISTDFSKKESDISYRLLPEETEIVHGYSRTEPNIVVIVPDMFVGGYMELIRHEEPELLSRFNGFTWYPNTLTISSMTASSLPSMLGGRDYTPLAMNDTLGSNRLKLNNAYGSIMVPLAEQGWNVSSEDPYQPIYGAAEDLITESYSSNYYHYWKDKNNIDDSDLYEAKESTILTMLGIFHGLPYSLKKTVYSNGNWTIIPESATKARTAQKVRKMWAALAILPEISNTESPVPTFKYIHTQLTHTPFAIGEDGEILFYSFPDPEAGNQTGGKAAYYSAKEFIRLMADYTDWLRQEGIYDNTMIIIVSDHGNNTANDDPFMPENISGVLEDESWFNRAHALLMVKGFGEEGDFSEDWTLMSNADTAEIISRAIDLHPEGTLAIDRPPTYSRLMTKQFLFYQSSKAEYKTWEVTESIFEAENWQRLRD